MYLNQKKKKAPSLYRQIGTANENRGRKINKSSEISLVSIMQA